MAAHLKYRPDIDGLRAISVLAVIAFHGGLGLTGGYVGVDVFFVISGFLITSLVVKQLEAGSFSLVDFWVRRIRRLYPAGLATMIAVLAVGWVLLLPGAFQSLAKDAFAHLLLVANVWFFLSSDYFGVAEEYRALLHTWSLAVEEQFYIFFPPLLAFVWRFGRRAAIVVFAVIAVVSLALSVGFVSARPMAAFYLTPMRAWELMIGVLLALLQVPPFRAAWQRNGSAVIGMLLIIVPVFVYDRSTPFPGLAALPPCLGTAMLIHSGFGESSRLNRVLSLEPLRVLGLMSYSLYLWHWPILVFLRHVAGETPPIGLLLLAYALIVIVSALSWMLVEAPIRGIRNPAGKRRVAVVAVVLSVVLAAVSVTIDRSKGFPGRFRPEVLAFGTPDSVVRAWDADVNPQDVVDDAVIPIGASSSRPCFLLWGDSHGMAFSEVIHDLALDANVSGAAALRLQSMPVPGVWSPATGVKGRLLADANDRVLEWVRRHRPRHVILVARWLMYVEGRPGGRTHTVIAPLDRMTTNRRRAEDALRDGLRELSEDVRAAGAVPWLLTEVPFQPWGPQQRAIIAHLTGRPPSPTGVDLESHRSHQRPVTDILDDLGPGALNVVDVSKPFFDDEGRSILADDGRSLYADGDHLNSMGTRVLLGETLRGLIDEIASTCRPAEAGGELDADGSPIR